MPRYETCWLIYIRRSDFHTDDISSSTKSFHLFLVYGEPASLWRSRRVKILNTNWRDCRHQSNSCVWVTFFGVDPVKRLLWGVQVCMLRLSPSILWFMITARTWMWSSWVFSVKSLHVLRRDLLPYAALTIARLDFSGNSNFPENIWVDV